MTLIVIHFEDETCREWENPDDSDAGAAIIDALRQLTPSERAMVVTIEVG